MGSKLFLNEINNNWFLCGKVKQSIAHDQQTNKIVKRNEQLKSLRCGIWIIILVSVDFFKNMYTYVSNRLCVSQTDRQIRVLFQRLAVNPQINPGKSAVVHRFPAWGIKMSLRRIQNKDARTILNAQNTGMIIETSR